MRDRHAAAGPAALTQLEGRRVLMPLPLGSLHLAEQVGDAFARRAGLTLLPETSVVDLHGTPTLLLHGDTLCLDDMAYQRIRVQLRHPDWQRQFLAQPLAARRAFAAQARAESAKHTGAMDAAIMDVTPSAVEQALSRFQHAEIRRTTRDVEILGDAIVMREREKSRQKRAKQVPENAGIIDVIDLISAGIELVWTVIKR